MFSLLNCKSSKRGIFSLSLKNVQHRPPNGVNWLLSPASAPAEAGSLSSFTLIPSTWQRGALDARKLHIWTPEASAGQAAKALPAPRWVNILTRLLQANSLPS